MPIASNATFTFTGYTPTDNGVEMTFVCSNPGPGQRTDYTISLTDSELAAITTQLELKNLVQTKLNKKIRAAGIASKLDGFIGQTLIV